MYGRLVQLPTIDKTQVDGAWTVDMNADAFEHQITVKVTGSPTAGTLTVAAKAADNTEYDDVDGGPIDMANGPYIFRVLGHFSGFQFTPSGFDGTDYDVYISSH